MISYILLSCNQTPISLSSTPIKTSSKNEEVKDIVGGEKVDSIKIEFDSSFPEFSISNLGLDSKHHSYVEGILNLTYSSCYKNGPQRVQLSELLHKGGYSSLSIQDRFILYLIVKETKKAVKDTNSKEKNLNLIDEIINKIHHPHSSCTEGINKWSEIFQITLHLPQKGGDKYLEVVDKLTLENNEIDIIEYKCDKIDITCNLNKTGMWAINGFIFSGIRSHHQVQDIINIPKAFRQASGRW